MAVCPTKNIDRYEWFLEKATEMGMDRVVPVIGEHSERKIVKSDRCEKILLSAAKQSLKGAVPVFEECCSVKQFIESFAGVLAGQAPASTFDAPAPLKLIAYCGEATKMSVKEALDAYMKGLQDCEQQKNGNAFVHIAILIGPEGDFSQQEVDLAIANGFIPVHLGKSRLRTETAAVVACCEVYSILG
jgi:16S rRNA (uracil1498-N3)-methyltransferase